MKQSVIALCASTAAATFGEWDSANYCAYLDKSTYVDDEEVSADYKYSSEACAYFCQDAAEDSDLLVGTNMCCDYEKFADDTYECNLYATNEVLPTDPTDYEAGAEELSFTFAKGDYALEAF
jgi:hypothetical protein